MSTTTTAHHPTHVAVGRRGGLVTGQVVQILPSAPHTAGEIEGLAVVRTVRGAHVEVRRLYDDAVLHLAAEHLADVESRCGLPAGFTARMHSWPEAAR